MLWEEREWTSVSLGFRHVPAYNSVQKDASEFWVIDLPNRLAHTDLQMNPLLQ